LRLFNDQAALAVGYVEVVVASESVTAGDWDVAAARGEFAHARGYYERALNVDDQLALTHFHLAVAQHETGGTPQALLSCRRALALDPLHVEVVLPVSEFGTVDVGEPATVVPGAPVGGEHKATVSVVDQVIDAASGTFGVRLELPNPELKLPAGRECCVRFSDSAAKDANG
jgi:tetratricopeptide (TPR) repeat protein